MTDNNERPSIQEMVDNTGDDTARRERRAWVGFVEGEVVAFMQANDIEKMTLDDGAGNKAKLTRRKDGGIYVECTSSNLL